MKKKSPSGVSTAKKFSLTSMVFGFVFGAVACAFYFLLSPPTKTGRGEVHMGANQFINPLIDCASQPNGTTPSKAPLKSLIQEIIREKFFCSIFMREICYKLQWSQSMMRCKKADDSISVISQAFQATRSLTPLDAFDEKW